MAHVFISYSHQDEADFFAQLKQKIEDEKIDYWTDEKISPGELWSKAIDDAIKSAFAVVVVMSPVATKSQYITYEWSYAMGLGKIIIPLVVTRGTKLHPKLSELQHIDFTNKNPDNWTRLMNKLQNILKMPLPHPIEIPQQKLEHPLIVKLDNERNDVRRNTIRTLADLKIKDSAQKLVNILENTKEPSSIREEAAMALGKLGVVEALPVLLFILRNTKGIGLRCAATQALGELGSEQAVPALLELVYSDKDDTVREIIVRSLAIIALSNETASDQIINDCMGALVLGNDFQQNLAAKILITIGSPQTIAMVETWEREKKTPPTT